MSDNRDTGMIRCRNGEAGPLSYKIRYGDKQGATDNLPWLSRSERVWLFAERHRAAVLTGILVAGLVAVVLGALLWFQHQREEEALALEDQAAQAYFGRSGDGGEAAKEKLATAERLYRQILEEFPRTNSAQLAWYLLGNVLTEQQQYAEAIDAYQNFIKQAGTHPVLLGLVYQRLGAAYLVNGEREKGIHAYTQVLEIPKTLNKDQVIVELAALEKQENHTDQALAHYKQLVEEHPNSPFASEAALQVKNLEPPPEASENDTTEGDTKQGEIQGGNANEE